MATKKHFRVELGFTRLVPGVSIFKGRTIRKVMGGGGGRGGGFSARTIFFFRPLLVQEFFLQVKPSARIFFQTNIALFVVY